MGEAEGRVKLTVTSFECNTSCDAVDDDEADDVTAIILDEAFELLDFLLHWVPYVLLTLWLHIDVWSADIQPENPSHCIQLCKIKKEIFHLST